MNRVTDKISYSGLVEKYINTAYDNVLKVADQIDSVVVVAGIDVVALEVLFNDTIVTVNASVGAAEAARDFAAQWASAPVNTLIDDGVNIPQFSAFNYASSASNDSTATALSKHESEASRLTSDSYATQAEDVNVINFLSNGDGTFTQQATTDFSAFHWAQKAQQIATNPNLVTFGSLIDTPANFVGQAGRIVAVNAGETALEYVPVAGGTSFVATVSALPLSGNVITVQGFHTPSDGAGGDFIWNPTRDTLNHNGGTVIDPTRVFPTDWDNQTELAAWLLPVAGVGCWERIVYDYIDVTWFGAKGDSVTNDTLVLRKALVNDFTFPIPVRFIKKGSYSIDGLLNITTSVYMENNCFIIWNGASSIDNNIINVILDNLSIKMNININGAAVKSAIILQAANIKYNLQIFNVVAKAAVPTTSGVTVGPQSSEAMGNSVKFTNFSNLDNPNLVMPYGVNYTSSGKSNIDTISSDVAHTLMFLNTDDAEININSILSHDTASAIILNNARNTNINIGDIVVSGNAGRPDILSGLGGQYRVSTNIQNIYLNTISNRVIDLSVPGVPPVVPIPPNGNNAFSLNITNIHYAGFSKNGIFTNNTHHTLINCSNASYTESIHIGSITGALQGRQFINTMDGIIQHLSINNMNLEIDIDSTLFPISEWIDLSGCNGFDLHNTNIRLMDVTPTPLTSSDIIQVTAPVDNLLHESTFHDFFVTPYMKNIIGEFISDYLVYMDNFDNSLISVKSANFDNAGNIREATKTSFSGDINSVENIPISGSWKAGQTLNLSNATSAPFNIRVTNDGTVGTLVGVTVALFSAGSKSFTVNDSSLLKHGDYILFDNLGTTEIFQIRSIDRLLHNILVDKSPSTTVNISDISYSDPSFVAY